MITDEILINNGYKKYDDKLYYADCLFQKRIRDDKAKTKYFIYIYKYSFKLENYKPRYEVRLYTVKDKYALDIYIYVIENKMKLEEIEKEVETIWEKLDCKYYVD